MAPLRYAPLQNLIPSFPWIAPSCPPPSRNPRKGRDQILPSGSHEPLASIEIEYDLMFRIKIWFHMFQISELEEADRDSSSDDMVLDRKVRDIVDNLQGNIKLLHSLSSHLYFVYK